MTSEMKVGEWYEGYISGFTGKCPVAKREAKREEAVIFVPGPDTKPYSFIAKERVMFRIARRSGGSFFVSNEYHSMRLGVPSEKKVNTQNSPGTDIALAIYDPAANFLLLLGKHLEEGHPHGKTRLNLEKTVRINLTGGGICCAYRHIKTMTGARELLSRVGYQGEIREFRLPGENSTDEKPTSMFEEVAQTKEGIDSSGFLKGVLERHLSCDSLPSIFPDVQFLNDKQTYWGTIQAGKSWPERWEDRALAYGGHVQ
jgi:hypothetical protein